MLSKYLLIISALQSFITGSNSYVLGSRSMRSGKKLDVSEYQLLADSFKGYTFVPYQFEKELTEAPFILPYLSVDDLLSDGIELHIDILKILAALQSALQSFITGSNSYVLGSRSITLEAKVVFVLK